MDSRDAPPEPIEDDEIGSAAEVSGARQTLFLDVESCTVCPAHGLACSGESGSDSGSISARAAVSDATTCERLLTPRSAAFSASSRSMVAYGDARVESLSLGQPRSELVTYLVSLACFVKRCCLRASLLDDSMQLYDLVPVRLNLRARRKSRESACDWDEFFFGRFHTIVHMYDRP